MFYDDAKTEIKYVNAEVIIEYLIRYLFASYVLPKHYYTQRCLFSRQ